MDELYLIMEEFIDVEYEITALVTVLKSLEEFYDMEYKKELRANMIVVIRQLDSLQKDLSEAITKIDEYLVKKD